MTDQASLSKSTKFNISFSRKFTLSPDRVDNHSPRFNSCQEDAILPKRKSEFKTIKSGLFKSLESECDQNAAFLYSKLELILGWKKDFPSMVFKTKDPILDICTNIFGIYGIKLNITYQDKGDESMKVKGVKEVEILHQCLNTMIQILSRFPCEFIKRIGLSTLTICGDLESRGSSLGLLDGVIVLKKHFKDADKLERHLLKIIYMYFIKQSPQVIEQSEDELKREKGKSAKQKDNSQRVQEQFDYFLDLSKSTMQQFDEDDLADNIKKIKAGIEALRK